MAESSPFDPLSLLGPVGTLGFGIAGMLGANRAQKRAEQEARRQKAMAELAIGRQGVASKYAVDRSTADASGAATQSAIDRGLGNSTVLDTGRAMAQEAGAQQKIGIDESLANRFADLQTQFQPSYNSNAATMAGQGIGAGFDALAKVLGPQVRNVFANPQGVPGANDQNALNAVQQAAFTGQPKTNAVPLGNASTSLAFDPSKVFMGNSQPKPKVGKFNPRNLTGKPSLSLAGAY